MTLEKPRAFVPKEKEKTIEAKTERTLGSLDTDRQKVTSYQTLLDIINLGRVTQQDLAVLFAGKTRTYNGEALLADRQNDYYKFNGDYRNESYIVKARPKDSEQQSLLSRLAAERLASAEDKRKSSDAVGAIKNILPLIISGRINENEIEVLFAGKTRTYNGEALLADRQNDYYKFAGDYRNEKYIATVRPGDIGLQTLIREFVAEGSVANAERSRATNALASFNNVLPLIAGRKTSSQDLAVLFAGKTRTYNGKGLLADRQNEYYKFSGDYRDENYISSHRPEDPDQQKLLIEFASLVENPAIPDELKASTARFIGNEGVKAAERISTLLDSEMMTPELEQFKEWFARFKATRRRLEFQSTFYKQLDTNPSIEQIAEFLGSYEEREGDDRKMISNLFEIASIKRRRDVIQAASTLITQKPQAYDEALGVLDVLGKSADERDQAAARVLAKALYRSELANYRESVISSLKADANPETVRESLRSLPLRPPIEDIDFLQEYTKLTAFVESQLVPIISTQRLDRANKIRAGFKETPEAVLKRIDEFPGETSEDLQAKRELLDLYRSSLAVDQPEMFDKQFLGEIVKRIEEGLKADFISPELGKNKQAFNYLRSNFVSTIFPLIETLRADPETKKTVEEFIGNGEKKGAYEQRVSRLAEQRPLTDVERAYLESVELLSVFNPYLVGAASADFGATNAFLRHHFDSLSERTLANLKDGDYVPLIQIGTGPNGVAALGEVVRNNANLAKSMLIVDAGGQPGGPFAIPEGPAWDLNSANRRGVEGMVLPGAPLPGEELKTVRAYGSPMRWYPGERDPGSDIRGGSINMTVDYLPAPDNLSTARYPTNEQLQTVLALQTSMLADRLALNTRVTSVEANKDLRLEGDKIVTLRIIGSDGETRELKLRTDAVFVATGLGEPSYGFKYEGSKAERIAKEANVEGQFPKISTTLEAFKALTARTSEYVSPGDSIAIWGRGNSADTLIELIGTIFQGDNPRVREVEKVYLIADGDLSSRPRYALLNDLKPRNGKGNLIEFVKSRVTDVDYATRVGEPSERRLVLINEKGEQITSKSGLPIQVDASIAATGFRPASDSVFKSYLAPGESLIDKTKRGSSVNPVELPTNKEVSVAETLKKDPNIVFLGTASDPRFNVAEKLGQLPVDARKALQRNGAENAVAIGFRAPDTQAAVNIWLGTRDVTVTPPLEEPRRTVTVTDSTYEAAAIPVTFVVDKENLSIPNNVDDDRLVLGPIFSYELGNAIQVQDEKGKRFTGEITYKLTLNGTPNAFDLSYVNGKMSPELNAEVVRVCQDKDFQRYALEALRKKRRNRSLEIAISFKNGNLDPANTFVQE